MVDTTSVNFPYTGRLPRFYINVGSLRISFLQKQKYLDIIGFEQVVFALAKSNPINNTSIMGLPEESTNGTF